MIIIAAVLAAALTIGSAHAEVPARAPTTPPGAPEDTVIDAMGGTPCALYLERRRKGEPYIDKLYYYWTLGLMSGLNTARLVSRQRPLVPGSQADWQRRRGG